MTSIKNENIHYEQSVNEIKKVTHKIHISPYK